MTIAIKTRNFSPNKTELTYEQSGFGWAPGQEKRFEGMGVNRIKYGKNYNRGKDVCVGCDKFKGTNSAVSEHCSLPASEYCQK